MAIINVSSSIFYRHALDLGSKKHDYTTDTIKVALLKSIPVAGATDITYATIVTPNEVTGSGYVAGGKSTTASWVMNNDKAVLDLTDLTWTVDAAGPTDIQALVVYNDTSKQCIAFADIRAPGNQDLSLQAGDVTVSFNVLGLYSLSMI